MLYRPVRLVARGASRLGTEPQELAVSAAAAGVAVAAAHAAHASNAVGWVIIAVLAVIVIGAVWRRIG
jgi:hypothetical protein